MLDKNPAEKPNEVSLKTQSHFHIPSNIKPRPISLEEKRI